MAGVFQVARLDREGERGRAANVPRVCSQSPWKYNIIYSLHFSYILSVIRGIIFYRVIMQYEYLI